MANLVGDHGSCRDRQPRLPADGDGDNGSGPIVRPQLGAAGDRLGDAQHLAARVVVVGELAGRRLDLDVSQALSIEEPPREVEGVEIDPRIDLRPFRVGGPHPKGRPAGDEDARQQHEHDVKPKVHLGTSTSWREVRRV